jgi:hypothetical protein
MLAGMEAQRMWVRGHFMPESTWKYELLEGKLYLLDGILKRGWIESHETWKLQSLGIVFGDALVQKLDLQWVEVEDEFGISPAVQYRSTSIIAFPQTMISKRIERGDTVEIGELFEGIVDLILDTINKTPPKAAP